MYWRIGARPAAAAGFAWATEEALNNSETSRQISIRGAGLLFLIVGIESTSYSHGLAAGLVPILDYWPNGRVNGGNAATKKRRAGRPSLHFEITSCLGGSLTSVSRSPSVRRPAAVRGPTAARGSTAVAARSRMAAAAGSRPSATTVARSRPSTAAVTRGRTSAAAVAAAIAAIRTPTIGALRDDRLPHVEWRARVTAVAPALWTVATTLRSGTAGRTI
jgi:hypothetical protein